MIGLDKLGATDARAVVTHFSGVSTVFALLFLAATAGGQGATRRAATTRRRWRCSSAWGWPAPPGRFHDAGVRAQGSPPRVSVVGLTQIVFALVYDLLVWRARFDPSPPSASSSSPRPSAWLMLHNPLRRSAAVHTTG